MRISQLNTPITFYKKTPAKDAYGASAPVESIVKKVKCHVLKGSGSHQVDNRENFYSKSLRVELYYRKEIQAGHKAKMGGATYTVEDVLPFISENRMELTITKDND